MNATVAYDLGYIEIDMRSTQPPQTKKLLHAVLSVTTNVVGTAFKNTSGKHYDRISCSINSYNVEGSVDSDIDDSGSVASPFSALVTITGKVFYNESTSWTQTNVTDFVNSIFAMNGDGSYREKLEMESDGIPFLSNLTYVGVLVDGDVVSEDTTGSDISTADNDAENSDPALDVWMIALIGGLGAFISVLCAVISCI